MIRFKLAEVLKARGWTAYRLAQEAGLESPHAYRLAKRTNFDSYKSQTLDILCSVLNCQVGDLLEWVPDTTKSRRRKKITKKAESLRQHKADS